MTEQQSEAIRLARIAIANARDAAKTAPVEGPAEAPEPDQDALSDCYRDGLTAARAALAEAPPRDPPDTPRTRESASDGYKRARAVYLTTRSRPPSDTRRNDS
jgi:hypothetical protein